MLNKVVESAAAAVLDIREGASLAVGGFGLNGIPSHLIDALLASGVGNLSIVSNNCGTDAWGLGVLLNARRIARITASYVGENKEFERQYLSGELAVELIPQGTLAERLRAGGSGVPAFYTPAGVGTQVAEGGIPVRHSADGTVAVASEPKEVRTFDGKDYVLERGLRTDYALVRASIGDSHGNLVFAKATQNFNPLAAMAGRITIAEVERLVEPGDIPPEQVHCPGVFIQRVLPLSPEQALDKRIERRTVSL